MYEDLEGKCAIVTGAGKKEGIGYAAAHKLASCGVNILLTDIGEFSHHESQNTTEMTQEMHEIASNLQQEFGIKAHPLLLDVTSNQSIAAMVGEAREQFEHIDILVNNAGVALGVPSEVRHYDESAWLKTIDVNLHGAFRMSKAVIPLMKAGDGNIINVSSRAGKVPPL